MNGRSQLYIPSGQGWQDRARATGARRERCQVIGRNHNLDAPESCVSKLDIDTGLSELPGQLAKGAGPILDIHHEHLALVGDAHPGTLERLPAPGHGLVVKEQVNNAPTLAGERRKTANADSHFASDLPQPGKPSTVSRRFSVTAGFYRTRVRDGILEHSPAVPRRSSP